MLFSLNGLRRDVAVGSVGHDFTVNSEIFARVYIRENSHMRSFVKIKSSRNDEITRSFNDTGKSCLSRI